jgi:hypothetical protein
MSTINDLRETLFSTLKGIQEGTIKPDQAKAMVNVADAIIDTARVEVDFLRVSGHKSNSGFITGLPTTSTQTLTGEKTVEGPVTTHRMR